MKKATYNVREDSVFLTSEDACALFRLGYSTIDRLARECGAKLKIGRAVRYNRKKLEAYIESFCEGDNK